MGNLKLNANIKQYITKCCKGQPDSYEDNRNTPRDQNQKMEPKKKLKVLENNQHNSIQPKIASSGLIKQLNRRQKSQEESKQEFKKQEEQDSLKIHINFSETVSPIFMNKESQMDEKVQIKAEKSSTAKLLLSPGIFIKIFNSDI